MGEEPFGHVHRDFRLSGFMQLVGASITIPEPGRSEVRAPFRPDLAQQNGFFHGGMSAALADVAAGYAAMSLFPPGSNMLAVEFTIHFLEPALGDELIARGQVIRKGRRLVTCRCDLFVVRDGVETLCGAVLETVSAKTPV